MQDFLSNKYTQGILVFFAVIGVYAVYQYGLYVSQPDATAESTTQPVTEMGDVVAEEDVSVTTDEEGVSENTDGTHIMTNGEVMKGSGEVVVGAVINDDGTITLPDGRVIRPVFDMRP